MTGAKKRSSSSTTQGVDSALKTLRVIWDAPLKIELAKREERLEKPPTKLALFLRFAAPLLMLIFALLSWLYIVPESHVASVYFAPAISGLDIAVCYPSYLSPGDESFVDLTITNRTNQQITGNVVVDFTGIPIQTALSESSAIDFETLEPGERTTYRIRFFLGEPPCWFGRDKVRFLLRAQITGGEQESISSIQTIHLAPIPYLKTILSGLASLSIAAFTGSILDRVLRWLLP